MFLTQQRDNAEKVMLYRQLGMLLALGLPLETALARVDSAGYRRLRASLRALQSDLAGGTAVGVACGRQPQLWGDFAFGDLTVNAAPKQLGRVFQLAADQLEESRLLKQRVLRVFWYPATTAAFGLLVLLVLCIFVLPAFARMFADFGGELPGPTQLLLHVGSLVTTAGPLVLLLSVTGLVLLQRRPALLLTLVARLPLFGSLLGKMQEYLFARLLGECLKVGLPLDAATRFAARAARFAAVERALAEAPAPLETGTALREVLERAAVYPPLIRQIFPLAPDAAGIAEVLTQVAGYSGAETEQAQHRALFVTEIVTLLVMASLVGLTVIGMYLPIFKLAGAAGG